MGHGMAQNIRPKVPESCKLVIYDINTATLEKFISEYSTNSNVVAATSPKHVAELAVSTSYLPIVFAGNNLTRSLLTLHYLGYHLDFGA
jgi:hypothetical protein